MPGRQECSLRDLFSGGGAPPGRAGAALVSAPPLRFLFGGRLDQRTHNVQSWRGRLRLRLRRQARRTGDDASQGRGPRSPRRSGGGAAPLTTQCHQSPGPAGGCDAKPTHECGTETRPTASVPPAVPVQPVRTHPPGRTDTVAFCGLAMGRYRHHRRWPQPRPHPLPQRPRPGGNRHRASANGAWGKSAVRAILGNPSCTGRQVWNRQRRDEELLDVDDVAAGYQSRMKWNDRSEWVWSAEETHEAIASAETFAAASAERAAGNDRWAVTKPEAPQRVLPVIARSLWHLWSPHERRLEPWRGVLPLPLPHRVRRGDRPTPEHGLPARVRRDPGSRRLAPLRVRPKDLDEAVAALSRPRLPTTAQPPRVGGCPPGVGDCDTRLAKCRSGRRSEPTPPWSPGGSRRWRPTVSERSGSRPRPPQPLGPSQRPRFGHW